MEKKYRDYFRYLDKFELDVISEEEARSIREGIRLQLESLNLEMIRRIIVIVGLMVCACVFLAAGLVSSVVWNYLVAAVFGIGVVVLCQGYKTKSLAARTMNEYIDKFSRMQY